MNINYRLDFSKLTTNQTHLESRAVGWRREKQVHSIGAASLASQEEHLNSIN
jgi:hypothetical protein